jgi:hypothetical protein
MKIYINTKKSQEIKKKIGFLMKDEEIKNRWREYFDKMFNGESDKITIELDDSFDDTNKHFF